MNLSKKIGRALLLGFITAMMLFGLLHASKKFGKFCLHFPHSDSGRQSYHQAVQRAAPAVVNIYSDLGSATQPIPQLGSGIIVTDDGYVVTNKHVVDKANRITVALADGRVFEARLIGSDTLTDIAVLQIVQIAATHLPVVAPNRWYTNLLSKFRQLFKPIGRLSGSGGMLPGNFHQQSVGATTHLPVIPYNTQLPARVGDVVLAIGNPFNLGQTVTQGIISATGRIRLSPYGVGKQNFIQTDAAINRGNSGGALVDTLGELVGVNTLILRNKQPHVGMPEGISFAVPAGLVLELMHKIIRDGRVIRGYIGFDVNELSAQQQSALGLKSSGLLVKSVDVKGSANGVIRPLDIIVRINGTPVISALTTMAQVAEFPPGTQITLTILRAGDEKSVKITVAEYPIH